ncbi:tetratricopeptide repeat protein [Marinoscillum furvescens]|uniref:Outer membrane protein assembly factor BamD (BamD/ComL family) n=1 Tax=Marinoscillum furvescens DSM 4134 TaxID=1122208 RepID=A0A3D9KZS1_MARFU|nr:tetratricopeptide repeat protein [Marinoscillum furvescens]RED94914.1 outer membrane protein assembly factor BamD (BamD/ComL family) [Marinoscillum furvescens DSM 4134]
MRIAAFLFSIASIHFTIAQQLESSSDPQLIYQQALEAYQQESYLAAVTHFERFQELSKTPNPEASYYHAHASLRVGDARAVAMIRRFIQDYPAHPLAGGAYFELGNYYFLQDDYAASLEYYSSVSGSQLPVRQQEVWYFRMGYAQLKEGDTLAAVPNLETVLEYRGDYHGDASYYLAVYHFESGNYTQALGYLESIADDEQFFESVAQMTAGIHYHTHNYQMLYRYADQNLKKANRNTQKLLLKLVGEARFEEEDYKEATTHLQRYVDLSSKRVDADTYYKLGYAYFQTGANEEAIDNFKLAGLEKGVLGQNSSFYLGQLYMRKNNINYAYSAFQTVAEGGGAMAEEAAFTMGKLNFQREQYAAAVRDFESFLEKHPNSRWKTEVNELMAQAYLRSSDYDQAINHLSTIRNKSALMKSAYQKVTFRKGQLLFNDQKFQRAVDLFDESLAFPMDRELEAQAFYLKGECHSLLNQPEAAKNAYMRCLSTGTEQWSNAARYGLAYIHYNQKQYTEAEAFFEDFIQNSFKRDELTIDARLRLADCYYVQKQYDKAIRQYKQVDSEQANAYIAYQLGLAYSLKGDGVMAQQHFEEVLRFPTSEYADNALFQLGQMHVENGSFDAAVVTIERLLSDFPNSPLMPYAHTRLALSYFNLDELAKAKASYEYVLKNYIANEVANAALLGLQEVMKKGQSVPNFEDYMQAYQQANPDDNSLEVVAFEAAKTSYYNQQYEDAANKLQAFLEKYPTSGFQEDARYFLADANYRAGNWSLASSQFQQVIAAGVSPYMGRSLDKRGKALIRQEQFGEAVNNYRFLLGHASNAKETYIAREGLMNAYFYQNKSDSALYFANQILADDWKPADAERATLLLKAKLFVQKENYDEALDELIRVVNDAPNERGAEAKYLMGKVYYLKGQYKRSLEMLFDLNRNYGSYPHWVGKSFLLIADNYLEMGELLQAKATTQSIIDNASDDAIVQEANEKMLTILEEEERVLVADSTMVEDTIR